MHAVQIRKCTNRIDLCTFPILYTHMIYIYIDMYIHLDIEFIAGS